MAADDLDALVRRVDPDRWLSSRFIADPAKRADVVALYAFDHELVRARGVTSNPLMAEIRLAWWREVLDEIFEGRQVRGHPTARALALAVSRRDLPRGPLQAMIDGRLDALDAEHRNSGLEASGAGVAEAAARILMAAPPVIVRELGALWARIVDPADEGRQELESRLRSARLAARSVSPPLLPAVLHLSLGSVRLAKRDVSALGARMRLVAAALSGRI